jgi:hypothetical protein
MDNPGTDDQVATDRSLMLIAIGEAMQAYARFEFSVFNLVDILLKARRESAAAVFYAITNNRDRIAGVTSLVRAVTGSQYITFLNSIMKHIRQTDEMRNRLAHGLVILDVEGETPRHLITKPVAYWIEEYWVDDAPYLTRSDVVGFAQKTDALKELVRHFGLYLRGDQPPDVAAKWKPIFAAMVEYPFPVGHPLAD